MVSLNKLSIRGVRSFGPEDDDEGTITFYPLTLILGPNGAGKTTIIESLRYATSGEFPPGTNKGKTWCHEIGLQGKTPSIKMQVKLQFQDTGKTNVTAVRSNELSVSKTGKKKQIKFRNLDGLLKREGSAMSTRCAAINEEMLNLLGVSRAILTNIIFCHQDESTWPMSEGKALKDRFDSIFGTTGYVKALEKVKKTRDKYMTEQNGLKKELSAAKDMKEVADKRTSELHAHEFQLKALKEKVNETKNKLQPLQIKLDDLTDKEMHINKVESEIGGIRGQLKEKQSIYDSIKSKIPNESDMSLDDLESNINDFDGTISARKQKIVNIEEKLRDLQKETDDLTTKQNNLLVTKGKLDQLEEFHKQDMKERNEIAAAINDDIGNIKLSYGSDFTDSDVDEINLKLNSKLSELNEQYEDEKQSCEKSENELMKKLDKNKNDKIKYEVTLHQNEKSVKEKKLEIENLDERLQNASRSASQLIQINSEILEIKEKLEKLDKFMPLEELKSDGEKFHTKRGMIRKELQTLNEERDRIQKESIVKAEYDLLEKSKRKEEEKRLNIATSYCTIMRRLGMEDEKSEKSFRRLLNSELSKIQEDYNNINEQMTQFRTEKKSLETASSMELNDLKVKNKEKLSLEDEVKKLSKDQNYDQILVEVENQIVELREKDGQLVGAKHVYSNYLKQIAQKSECPLCLRSADAEIQNNLKTTLQTSLKNLPRDIDEVKTQLEEKESRRYILQQTKPKLDTIKKLTDEISRIEESSKEKLNNVKVLKKKIDECEDSLQDKKIGIDECRAAEKAALDFDRSREELIELETRMKSTLSRIGLSDDSQFRLKKANIEDIKQDIDAKTREQDSIDRKIKETQGNINKYNDDKNKLNSELNSLEGDKLRIERNQQEVTSMQQKKETLEENISDINRSHWKLKDDINEKESQMSSINLELKNALTTKESKLKSIKVICDRIEKFSNSLKTVNKKISKYIQDGNDLELAKALRQVSTLEAQKDELKKKMENLSKVLDEANKFIGNALEKRREMEDNRLLKTYRNEIDDFVKRIQKYEAEFMGYDLKTIQNEKSKLAKEISLFEANMNKDTGKQVPLIEVIDHLKADLRVDKMRNAHKLYVDTLIELTTVTVVCGDLDKSYKALSHSVSVFHQRSLEEVNKLILKFWTQIYKGGDIEYVKIVCDEDDNVASKRKVYSYRVVMCVDGIELDARGRCSAGQKMIASVIIRVAIAQIFCGSCGILSLDEPTTNLDGENVKSLADCISQLVKYHQKSKDFQLIIITHDEEFLKCLNEETCEFYYRINKDENGLSRIEKCSISDREV